MKKTGILIVAIGLLITIYTGINIVTKEKVVDIGKLEITRNKNHRLNWSPAIGVAVMAIGGFVIMLGAKKK